MADPAAGPERGRVVTGQSGVGAAHPVAVATRVDEPRVPLPHLVGAEAETFEGVGAEAGEQHVGRLEQAIEYLLAAVGAEVQRHRPLAAVGERDRQVHARRCSAPMPWVTRPRYGSPSGRSTAHHIGTPVGQQRAGDGHEDPLCQLDDPDSLERVIHRVPPPVDRGSPWWPRSSAWRRRARRSWGPCTRRAGPWRRRSTSSVVGASRRIGRLDDGVDPAAPLVVPQSDHDDVGDLRVVDQRRLHLRGEDVGAPGDDHVDATIGDVEVTVVVEVAHVADGLEPVVGRPQLRRVTEVVGSAVGGRSHEDLADLTSRDVVAGVVENPDLGAPLAAADAALVGRSTRRRAAR